jgi:steroid delta-isomerase-like uncharacterized protein
MAGSLELLRKWIDAFNGHDIDALVGFYHPEAVNSQVAAGDPARGIEKIRSDFEEFFRGFPDSFANAENIMADGDWAAWEWEGGGTFLGDFAGMKPNGRSYRLRGCGFFRFENGRIILQRGYWDRLTWFSQLGISV